MLQVMSRRNLSLRWGCLLLCAAALLGYAGLNPRHNWDMVAYAAAGYSYLGLKGAELHRAAYDDVRAAASAERFKALTERSRFQRTLYADPVALEQRSHYRTRVAYVLLALAASLFTATVSAGTVAVSAGAGAAALLLAGALAAQARPWALLLLPLALAATGLGEAARLSTPDALAAMTALCIVARACAAPA